MTCNHCAHFVQEAIQRTGVTDVYVDLHNQKAYINGDFDPETVKNAIVDAGYKAGSIC